MLNCQNAMAYAPVVASQQEIGLTIINIIFIYLFFNKFVYSVGLLGKSHKVVMNLSWWHPSPSKVNQEGTILVRKIEEEKHYISS